MFLGSKSLFLELHDEKIDLSFDGGRHMHERTG